MKFLIYTILYLCLCCTLQAKSSSACIVGTGLAYHEGNLEMGYSMPMHIGWMHGLGKYKRLSMLHQFQGGSYRPVLITDIADQYYRQSIWRSCIQYHFIQKNWITGYFGGGLFAAYVRGLIGTGAYHATTNQSSYFYHLRAGVSVHAGIQFQLTPSAFSIDCKPLVFDYGYARYVQGAALISLIYHIK